MNDKVQKRIERLEFVCAKQEREHFGRVRELEPMFQVCPLWSMPSFEKPHPFRTRSMSSRCWRIG